MKLTELLIATWCSIIVARSETAASDQEALLRRAAEQLERLTPYRRTAEDRGESDVSGLLLTTVDQNHLDGMRSEADQGVPWEILEILPEQTDADAKEKIDDEKLITIGVIADPRYAAMMQERIKRGFDLGSASLLTGIAGGVLSGVASASSSSAGKALASSSQSAFKPAYGAPTVEHTYSYDEKPFGPWEFKKAIFGTLFQALKAIGGGVLALKGQLVKGGGYLLASKSKAVSKAGEVITSFGKQLAASAVVEPKPYPPDTYYDHPPNIGQDTSYLGPPPSPDDYSEDYTPHETYNVPSDDNNQGGLLIVTPTKSDLDEHSDQHTNMAVQENPDPAKLEESFGGPIKSPIITNLLNSVPKGSIGLKDQAVVSQDNNNNHVDSYPPTQHPVYGAPNHYSANHVENTAQNYGNLDQNHHAVQDNVHQELEPPHITSSHHHYPHLGDPSLSVQPSLSYLPFQHPANADPHDGLLGIPPKVPHDDDGTSVYASLSVDTEPQMSPFKVPLLGHPGALDLPKLQPHVSFHGQPQFTNHLHGSLGGPLKVPLLNPIPPAYYWHSQGSVVPTSPFNTLDQFRKRNALQRRAFAKRFARYASLPRTRLHRP